MITCCSCMNVLFNNIHEGKSSSTFGFQEKINDDFFNNALCIDAPAVRIQHFEFVNIRQVGKWHVYRCINCNTDTHAIFREETDAAAEFGIQEFLINKTLLENPPNIPDLMKGPEYSKVFKIVVSKDYPVYPSVSTAVPENNELPNLRLQLATAVTNESTMTETRVRRYTSQQYSALQTFTEKANRDFKILLSRKEGTDRLSKYSMNLKETGKALIIMQNDYKTCLRETRVAPAPFQEVRRISNVLKGLRFNVLVYEDPKMIALNQCLHTLASLDHTQHSALIIVVLAHMDNYKLCAKDDTYDIRRLWEPFKNDRCPSLAGKPKMVIIESCMEQRKNYAALEDVQSLDIDQVPTTADFLVVYNRIRGQNPCSKFVTVLCNELGNNEQIDVVSKITKVIRKTISNAGTAAKETPRAFSTLRKKLYLRAEI